MGLYQLERYLHVDPHGQYRYSFSVGMKLITELAEVPLVCIPFKMFREWAPQRHGRRIVVRFKMFLILEAVQERKSWPPGRSVSFCFLNRVTYGAFQFRANYTPCKRILVSALWILMQIIVEANLPPHCHIDLARPMRFYYLIWSMLSSFLSTISFLIFTKLQRQRSEDYLRKSLLNLTSLLKLTWKK